MLQLTELFCLPKKRTIIYIYDTDVHMLSFGSVSNGTSLTSIAAFPQAAMRQGVYV